MLNSLLSALAHPVGTATVQIPELVWIVLVSGVLWFKALNVRDARQDLKLLKTHNVNHFREVVARSILFTDSARALVALLYLGIGIEALFENPHDPYKEDFGFYYFAGSLFASAAIFLWTAWYSRITRKRLVAMWEDAQLEIEESYKKLTDLETKAITLAAQTKLDATSLANKTKTDKKIALDKSNEAIRKARKRKTDTPESPEV